MSNEEQAALDELERLQRALEESRRRRRQADEAFESFVRSFAATRRSDAGAHAAPPRQPAALAPAAPPPARPAAPPATPQAVIGEPAPVPTRIADLEPIESAPAVRELPVVPAALSAAGAPRRRRIAPAAALSALILAGVVAAVVWQGRVKDAADEAGAGQPAASEGRTVPQATPQPVPAAPPEPVAELLTLRAVWVRVLVDDARVLERELPANARIPLSPHSRIVIRAGDGGAVRVSIRGADQGRFGPDGQPATRTFLVAPAR